MESVRSIAIVPSSWIAPHKHYNSGSEQKEPRDRNRVLNQGTASAENSSRVNVRYDDVAPYFIAIICAVRRRKESPANIPVFQMERLSILEQEPRSNQKKDIETRADAKPRMYAPDEFLPVSVQNVW